jgi:hypothetical protein
VNEDDEPGLKVYFNPFRFSVEQNNDFIRRGYEVMPLQIPDMRRPEPNDG